MPIYDYLDYLKPTTQVIGTLVRAHFSASEWATAVELSALGAALRRAPQETGSEHLDRLGSFIATFPGGHPGPRLISGRSVLYATLAHFSDVEAALVARAAARWASLHARAPPPGRLSVAHDFTKPDGQPLSVVPAGDVDVSGFRVWFSGLSDADARRFLREAIEYNAGLLHVFRVASPATVNELLLSVYDSVENGAVRRGSARLHVRPLTYSLVHYDWGHVDSNALFLRSRTPFSSSLVLLASGARADYVERVPTFAFPSTPLMALLAQLVRGPIAPFPTERVAAVVRALVSAGCDVDYRNGGGVSALEYAVTHVLNRTLPASVVRILLEAGAAVDLPFSDGIPNALLACAVYVWRARRLFALRLAHYPNRGDDLVRLLSAGSPPSRLTATATATATDRGGVAIDELSGSAYDFWVDDDGSAFAARRARGRNARALRL